MMEQPDIPTMLRRRHEALKRTAASTFYLNSIGGSYECYGETAQQLSRIFANKSNKGTHKELAGCHTFSIPLESVSATITDLSAYGSIALMECVVALPVVVTVVPCSREAPLRVPAAKASAVHDLFGSAAKSADSDELFELQRSIEFAAAMTKKPVAAADLF